MSKSFYKDVEKVKKLEKEGEISEDMDFQQSTDSLTLAWSGSDNASGIDHYEYAWGTTAGAAGFRDGGGGRRAPQRAAQQGAALQPAGPLGPPADLAPGEPEPGRPGRGRAAAAGLAALRLVEIASMKFVEGAKWGTSYTISSHLAGADGTVLTRCVWRADGDCGGSFLRPEGLGLRARFPLSASPAVLSNPTGGATSDGRAISGDRRRRASDGR